MNRRLIVVALSIAALAVGASTSAAELAPRAAGAPAPALDAGYGSSGIAAQPAGRAALGVRFIDVAIARDGRTYAVGHVNLGGTGGREQAMAVGRLNSDGSLDSSFGDGGLAVVNVAPGRGGAEIARGIGVQRDGKIVIAGQAESNTAGADPRDINVFAARFSTDGVLDPSFAGDGVLELDFSPGALNPGASYRTDQAYGLAMSPDDKPVIVAVRGPDTTLRPGRYDRDFAITRLTRDGSLDSGWSGDGVAILNTRGPGGNPANAIEDLNESPRQAIAQSDRKVVVASYSEGSDGRAEGRLIRFLSDGDLDPNFGVGGVATVPDFFPDGSRAEVAEFYSVGRHADGYVVGGYGAPTTTGKVDMIAARFTGKGKLDRSWGTTGRVIVDVGGDDDRARDLVALPDGRVLLAGSTASAGNLKAMVVALNRDGSFVSGFGTGGKLQLELGSPNDAFFGITATRDGSAATAVGHVAAANGGSGRVDAGDQGRSVRVARLRP